MWKQLFRRAWRWMRSSAHAEDLDKQRIEQQKSELADEPEPVAPDIPALPETLESAAPDMPTIPESIEPVAPEAPALSDTAEWQSSDLALPDSVTSAGLPELASEPPAAAQLPEPLDVPSEPSASSPAPLDLPDALTQSAASPTPTATTPSASPSVALPDTIVPDDPSDAVPQAEPSLDVPTLDLPEDQPPAAIADTPLLETPGVAPEPPLLPDTGEPVEAPSVTPLPDADQIEPRMPAPAEAPSEAPSGGPPPPSLPDIESMLDEAERELELPSTNRLRVPPEMANRELPPPPPGFEVSGQPPIPLPPPPDDPAQNASDKPMTERQGEQIIRLLEQQVEATKEIASAQGAMAAAIQQLAYSMQNAGGVGP